MDDIQNDWDEDEPSDAKRFRVRKQKYYTHKILNFINNFSNNFLQNS